jgi:hypothetical protein
MNRIPHEAMAAFCEGDEEDRQRPENNTPTARARRALGGSVFCRVDGPVTVSVNGDDYAMFATRHGVLLTRHVLGNPGASARATDYAVAMLGATRHQTDLAALREWLYAFDGSASVRVFGVPMVARQLYDSFEAFSSIGDGAYAVVKIDAHVGDEEAPGASMLCIESDGVSVTIAPLESSKNCVAAWPIPVGVRE